MCVKVSCTTPDVKNNSIISDFILSLEWKIEWHVNKRLIDIE
jgi:hypothetical protein